MLLIISTAVAAAQAPVPDPAIAKAVRGLEHDKFEALQRKDTHALDSILDDTLLLVDEDGTLSSKAQYLADVHNSRATVLRIVPESIAVRVFDGLAIAVGIYEERGARAGRSYHRRCRFIDTWIHKDGRWVCIAATATSAIA